MRIIIFLGIMSKIKVMLVLVLFLVFKVVFLGKKNCYYLKLVIWLFVLFILNLI